MPRARGTSPGVQHGQAIIQSGARPWTPSASTREAANSIASGKPSSLRQISTTMWGVRIGQLEIFHDRGRRVRRTAAPRENRRCLGDCRFGGWLRAARAGQDGTRVRHDSQDAPCWSPGWLTPGALPELPPPGSPPRQSRVRNCRAAAAFVCLDEASDEAGQRIFRADFEAEHSRDRAWQPGLDRPAVSDRPTKPRVHSPRSTARRPRARPWSCRSLRVRRSSPGVAATVA